MSNSTQSRPTFKTYTCVTVGCSQYNRMHHDSLAGLGWMIKAATAPETLKKPIAPEAVQRIKKLVDDIHVVKTDRLRCSECMNPLGLTTPEMSAAWKASILAGA